MCSVLLTHCHALVCNTFLLHLHVSSIFSTAGVPWAPLRSSKCHGGAGSSGGHGRWSERHSSRHHTTPPKRNPWGSYGYQEPSGARQTGQDSPQEQEALLGLSSYAEASFGHDGESGALPGSLSNRLHFSDRRGRGLGMASVATTRGAA